MVVGHPIHPAPPHHLAMGRRAVRSMAAALLALGVTGGGCQTTPQTGPPVTAAAAPANPPVAAISTPRPTTTPAPTHPPATQPMDFTAALSTIFREDETLHGQAMDELLQRMNHNEIDCAVMRRVTAQVRTNLAAQVQALLILKDPETQARVQRLLAFQSGLAAFTVAALDASPEQRPQLLAWGLTSVPVPTRVRPPSTFGGNPAARDTMIPAVLAGQAFSVNQNDRQQAAAALAEVSGDPADWLLARLIDDAKREVSLAAMNAAWGRPLTAPLVDILWQKMVVYPLHQYGMGEMLPPVGASKRLRLAHTNKEIKVGGRQVNVDSFDNTAALRSQDGDVAADLLVLGKNALVEEKLTELLTRLAAATGGNSQQLRNALLQPNYAGAGLNVQRLLEEIKPRAAVGLLVQLALTSSSDGWENNVGGQNTRCSTRIDAVGLLVTMLDLDKDDYKLIRSQMYNNRWAVAGGQAQEDAAIKKLKEWWNIHRGEYEPPK